VDEGERGREGRFLGFVEGVVFGGEAMFGFWRMSLMGGGQGWFGVRDGGGFKLVVWWWAVRLRLRLRLSVWDVEAEEIGKLCMYSAEL